MALAFEDVMKKEPFCSDAELLKLNFSARFCDRIIKIYGFSQTSRKSDQVYIPPAVLESHRQGLILKMGRTDHYLHVNCDETIIFVSSYSIKSTFFLGSRFLQKSHLMESHLMEFDCI